VGGVGKSGEKDWLLRSDRGRDGEARPAGGAMRIVGAGAVGLGLGGGVSFGVTAWRGVLGG
jgi:hypothetical protein